MQAGERRGDLLLGREHLLWKGLLVSAHLQAEAGPASLRGYAMGGVLNLVGILLKHEESDNLLWTQIFSVFYELFEM